MRPHNTPGTLITFCGLDGSGKTTQIELLKDFFEEMDLPVVLTKQPTDFVRKSDIFRTYMDQPDHDAYDYRALSLLCASDRVQHSNRVIMPLLEEGNIVISDRYYYCCLANLQARGYTEDRWIYEVAQSIPRPDFSFFLNVNPALAINRVRARPEEKNRYIDTALQYRLHEAFSRIAAKNSVTSIDSSFDPGAGALAIQAEVMRELNGVSNTDVVPARNCLPMGVAYV